MAITTPTVSPFTPVPIGTPTQVTPTTVDQASLTTPTATTAQDQLAGILNKGGALMQSAATSGSQSAAARGLLNSSMGVQAAQGAMIDRAAPIAQNDANAINQMTSQNASTLNQNLQQNAATTNTANQWNAAQQNEFAKANSQNANAATQWNAAQQNEATLRAMDVNSREQLANIEAQYKTQMQTSASADALYSQVMKNINEIQLSKDVADKQTAINSQLAWLRSGMQMVQNLNGVTGLVTF